MSKKKFNFDNVIIDHRPNGPYADHGLDWYYTFGDFDGWAPSEKVANERVETYIKSSSRQKNQYAR